MESVMFKLQYQTIHIPRRMKNSKRKNDNPNIVATMMQVVPNFPAPVTARYMAKKEYQQSLLLLINFVILVWSKCRDSDLKV